VVQIEVDQRYPRPHDTCPDGFVGHRHSVRAAIRHRLSLDDATLPYAADSLPGGNPQGGRIKSVSPLYSGSGMCRMTRILECSPGPRSSAGSNADCAPGQSWRRSTRFRGDPGCRGRPISVVHRQSELT
jgi:hypothetical protein